MLEELEEMLIQADMGVETALRVTANIAEGRSAAASRHRAEGAAGGRDRADHDPGGAAPQPIYPKRPQVVLVVGGTARARPPPSASWPASSRRPARM